MPLEKFSSNQAQGYNVKLEGKILNVVMLSSIYIYHITAAPYTAESVSLKVKTTKGNDISSI